MSKVKQLYFILSTLFVTLVAGTLASEAYSFVELSNLQSIAAEQAYYNEKLAEKENILSSLEDRYNTIKSDVGIIKETLPEDKDASKLVSDLNSIATKAGLRFTNIESRTSEESGNSKKKTTSSSDPSLLQTVKGSFGYEMPLSITVEGSYSKLVPFIEGVESYQRLINIEYIQIDRIEHETINDYVEASLDVTAYLKK